MKNIKTSIILILTITASLNLFAGKKNRVIYDVEIFNHSETVVYSTDESVVIANLITDEIIKTFHNTNAESFISLDVSEDDKFVIAGSKNGIVSLWNLENEELIMETSIPGAVTDIKLSNNTFYASCSNNNIYKYNYFSKELIQEFIGHSADVTAIELTKDNKYLISASGDNHLIIWNIQDGEIIDNLKKHEEWVRDISINKNNQMISCDDDGNIIYWDIENINNIKIIIKENISKHWITSVELYENIDTYVYGTVRGELFFITPNKNHKINLGYPILDIKGMVSTNNIYFIVTTLGKGSKKIRLDEMDITKYKIGVNLPH